MEIRQAILKAADHIEKHPLEFRFSSVTIPDGPDCGSPGCALGWIGHFSDMRCVVSHQVANIMGLPAEIGDSACNSSASEFYKRMFAINGSHSWKYNAALCALTLRGYADKYHPAKPSKPLGSEIALQIMTKPFSEKEYA